MLDALQNPVELRAIERASKRPAVAARPTEVRVEITVECLQRPLFHLVDQGRGAALRYVQLGQDRNPDVLRRPHLQDSAEQAARSQVTQNGFAQLRRERKLLW